jgi:hypothetical protein
MSYNYKISVCLCIRDGEEYLKYLNNLFTQISNLANIKFEYFIYENDSVDNTKKEIVNFFKEREGKYKMETENLKTYSGISKTRGMHMALIRNKLKFFHGLLNSDMVLLLDCDVVFLPETLISIIDSLVNDKECGMVTPFDICWCSYKANNSNYHYYDSFALITKDSLSYKENGNTCMFDSCESCKNHRKKRNIKIDEKMLLSSNKLVEVKSSFGGFALIKTDIYNKIKWSDSICEHHSFCEEVRKYGKIYINPNIKIITTSPSIRDYSNISLKLQEIITK